MSAIERNKWGQSTFKNFMSKVNQRRTKYLFFTSININNKTNVIRLISINGSTAKAFTIAGNDKIF